MGPDRAVVVRERVVGGGARRTSSARPSPTRARRPSAPSTTASTRSSGTIPLQSRWPTFEQSESTLRSVAVERQRVVLARPVRLVEALLQVGRLALEPLGELRLAPDLARELGRAPLRVVGVALHLDRRDRRLGDAPVGEALRVARVLPRLVLEPALGAPLVRDEARRGESIQPSAAQRRLAQLADERRRRRVQRQTSESSTR